jgi:serine/threonine protein kinase/formylglycine-generating enzyme required for sulfatase activity
VDDQSRPAESHDPRIDAALHEYLERVDRGEMLDPQSFIAQHTDIADELRSLIEAEVELRELASGDAQGARADTSTRSFALQGQETIAPQAQLKQADGSTRGGLKEQFGRYRIVKVLGQGAMGTVYLAEDTQLKRQVALKTPHFDTDPSGELLERLYREARAAATLRHPNICPVHDVGEIDGTHYISMAYIEGHPLSAFVRSSKPQPERQTLIVVRKLAQALQEAHEQKIVHRDLKPANIMVDKRGEPLIMDFGLARHTRPDEDVRLTHSGTLVGTPAYMAPEQVDADSAKIGPLTDEYSLGVILYELLTGQLPFRGSMMAVLGQIVTKNPTPPSQLRPGLDPRIEAACLKMMSKNPSDRFPSLTAAADELASILKNPGARPAAPGKSATSLTLPAAIDVRAPSGAGSSKILKSQTLKTLTGSDLESLEELARKCWSRHDYDQVIQIAERIPDDKRNAGLQTLLEKARSRADEISFLVVEIDEAVRLEDRQAALKKVDALLKIKPGHHRGLEVQAQFSGHGDGGAARLGPRRLAQAWRDGGWIPWSALAFGLAVVGVVAGVIIIWLGKTVLVIDAKDPGIEVTVKGMKALITAPGEQSVTVEPGDHELKVSYAGLETVTKSFSLKKGQTQRLRVEILDGKLGAKLQGDVLPLITDTEKAKGVGGVAAESKAPVSVAAAPVSAESPTNLADGFVPLFNGKDTSGWKTHPSQPANWRVKNGVLIGSGAEKSHLYTERGDFKDFRLRAQVRINDGGNSGLYFRSGFGPARPADHPKFPYGYEAQIDSTGPVSKDVRGRSDPTRTGSLYLNGEAVVAISDTLVPPGQWFTEEVIVQGSHITVKVNDQTTAVHRDEKIPASGYIALQIDNANTVAEFRKIEIKELSSSAPTEPSTASQDGYVSLFNSKDLAGWTKDPSRPGAWQVDKGVLSGGPAGEGSFLYSDRDNYKNFRLRVEARVKDNEHCELWIRTQIPPSDSPDKRPTVGFKVDLQESTDDRKSRTGSIWAVRPRAEGGRIVSGYARKEPMVQPGRWFTLEFVAERNRVYALVNGESSFKTNWLKQDQTDTSGRIAIEQHVGEPSVEFRKIEIKELPDSPLSSVTDGNKSTHPLDKDAMVAPFDGSQAKAAQQRWSERLRVPADATNSIGMRLELVPPGQFSMGVQNGVGFVAPVHDVLISRPFYLGTFEVTRGQFAAFVARTQFKTRAERGKGGWRLDNNSGRRSIWDGKHQYTWRSPGFPQENTHPVVDVCWDDAEEFCRWLSRTEGKTYRLPTEAEWEYAAHAGTPGGQYNGGGDVTQIANVADASTKDKFPAWNGINASDGFVFTSPAGHFRPNNFGLYDMLGNAMEWCSDWYDEDYYKISPATDPPGAPAGKFHSARGGTFTDVGNTNGRWRFPPDHHAPDCGFRVVCEIPAARPIAELSSAAGSPAAGDNHHAWIGKDSRFDRIAAGKWRETFPNDPGHAIFFFDEVTQTSEYLELIDRTRIKSKGGVSVRLGDNQALMRWGGPDKDFKPLQRGQWVTAPLDQDTALSHSDNGFVSLFNGIDTSGWKPHKSQPGNWRVENGVLIGAGPTLSHLYTERADFKDFDLRVEARINAGGNSGVIFRTKFGPAWPAKNPKFPLGYEAQIDSTSHAAKTGSLFVISGGGGSGSAVVSIPESPVPAGEWFTMELSAKGNRIVIKVNGTETAKYSDSHFRNGHIALQQHDAKTVVEFRKIEIRDLSGVKAPIGGL